jgi:hypothetical protein
MVCLVEAPSSHLLSDQRKTDHLVEAASLHFNRNLDPVDLCPDNLAHQMGCTCHHCPRTFVRFQISHLLRSSSTLVVFLSLLSLGNQTHRSSLISRRINSYISSNPSRYAIGIPMSFFCFSWLGPGHCLAVCPASVQLPHFEGAGFFCTCGRMSSLGFILSVL